MSADNLLQRLLKRRGPESGAGPRLLYAIDHFSMFPGCNPFTTCNGQPASFRASSVLFHWTGETSLCWPVEVEAHYPRG
jgi:hypothetical protein